VGLRTCTFYRNNNRLGGSVSSAAAAQQQLSSSSAAAQQQLSSSSSQECSIDLDVTLRRAALQVINLPRCCSRHRARRATACGLQGKGHRHGGRSVAQAKHCCSDVDQTTHETPSTAYGRQILNRHRFQTLFAFIMPISEVH